MMEKLCFILFARALISLSAKNAAYIYACVHVSRKERRALKSTLCWRWANWWKIVFVTAARGVRQFLYMHHVFLQLFVPPQRGKKALLVAGGGIKTTKARRPAPCIKDMTPPTAW
jgi:hypothetical protein